MADVQLTMVAHLADTPALAWTDSGIPYAKLRLGSTPRRRDRNGDWTDGETVWLDATCWRQLGENVTASLSRGDRVVVTGKLRQRSYEVEAVRRTAYEIEVDSVAPDLAFATAHLRRNARPSPAATPAEPDVEQAEAGPDGLAEAGRSVADLSSDGSLSDRAEEPALV